jgi:hypothetical protein
MMLEISRDELSRHAISLDALLVASLARVAKPRPRDVMQELSWVRSQDADHQEAD